MTNVGLPFEGVSAALIGVAFDEVAGVKVGEGMGLTTGLKIGLDFCSSTVEDPSASFENASSTVRLSHNKRQQRRQRGKEGKKDKLLFFLDLGFAAEGGGREGVAEEAAEAAAGVEEETGC